MSASSPIRAEPLEGAVWALRIASDERPYLDAHVVPALAAAVARLGDEPSAAVRAVVVTGGDRYFSGGASRDALAGADAHRAIAHFCAEVPRLLLGIPVPTVAAMVGHGVGGGLLLGLWCDVAVLAEESLYGANFMRLGFTPGMGATTVLEEALGAPLAREMLFAGRLVKGRELRAAGGPLAHAVAPRAEVLERALAIAREMAEAPPEAARLLKRTLAGRRRARLEQALGEEHAMHAALFPRADVQARIAEAYGA